MVKLAILFLAAASFSAESEAGPLGSRLVRIPSVVGPAAAVTVHGATQRLQDQPQPPPPPAWSYAPKAPARYPPQPSTTRSLMFQDSNLRNQPDSLKLRVDDPVESGARRE